MGRVVSWCLGNKSVVFLATLLLIGSGIFATTRLNQELLPDVDFPVILVSTPVPGAGPDVVDEQVSQPVEGASTPRRPRPRFRRRWRTQRSRRRPPSRR